MPSLGCRRQEKEQVEVALSVRDRRASAAGPNTTIWRVTPQSQVKQLEGRLAEVSEGFLESKTYKGPKKRWRMETSTVAGEQASLPSAHWRGVHRED